MVVFYAAIFLSRLALDNFTYSLDSPLSPDNACTHCGKNDQWISHGYVYKDSSSDGIQVAGKRILCSDRYGRAGCGHTRQLYLADVIPRRQYRLSAVIAFIKALLVGALVEPAYLDAIGSTAKEARHGWRWIKDFLKSLAGWRILSSKPVETFVAPQRSHDLTVLLPTLERLVNGSILSTIHSIQLHCQRAFF